jgi:hypothetical protein
MLRLAPVAQFKAWDVVNVTMAISMCIYHTYVVLHFIYLTLGIMYTVQLRFRKILNNAGPYIINSQYPKTSAVRNGLFPDLSGYLILHCTRYARSPVICLYVT